MAMLLGHVSGITMNNTPPLNPNQAAARRILADLEKAGLLKTRGVEFLRILEKEAEVVGEATKPVEPFHYMGADVAALRSIWNSVSVAQHHNNLGWVTCSRDKITKLRVGYKMRMSFNRHRTGKFLYVSNRFVKVSFDDGVADDHDDQYVDPDKFSNIEYFSSDAAREGLRKPHLLMLFPTVKKMIENFLDENLDGTYQHTQMTLAAKHDNLQLVKEIERQDGRDSLRAPCGNGWTPLIAAADSGKLFVLRYLIQDCNFNYSDATEKGTTALSRAVQNDDTQLLKYLHEDLHCDLTAKTSVRSERFNHNEASPLSLAAGEGSVKVINYLAGVGIDFDACDVSNHSPATAAACNNEVQALKALHSNGCDLTKPSRRQWTPMTIACQYGRFEIVKLLHEEYGLDLMAVDGAGYFPYMMALKGGHLDIVKYIDFKVQIPIDHDKLQNPNGFTPVTLAARHGQVQIIEYLVDKYEVDICQENKNGNTAATQAAHGNHVDVLHFLQVKGGMDLTKSESKGWTPVSIAAASGATDVLDFLWSRFTGEPYADPNAYKSGAPICSAAGCGKLMNLQTGGYAETWVCDRCQKQYPVSLPRYFCCVAHDNDICESCVHAKERDLTVGYHMPFTHTGWNKAVTITKSGPLHHSQGWIRDVDPDGTYHIVVTTGDVRNAKDFFEFEQSDREGFTPLTRAAKFDVVASLKWLAKKGFDFRAEDAMGRTAMSLASTTDSIAIIEEALQQSAN